MANDGLWGWMMMLGSGVSAGIGNLLIKQSRQGAATVCTPPGFGWPWPFSS